MPVPGRVEDFEIAMRRGPRLELVKDLLDRFGADDPVQVEGRDGLDTIGRHHPKRAKRDFAGR